MTPPRFDSWLIVAGLAALPLAGALYWGRDRTAPLQPSPGRAAPTEQAPAPGAAPPVPAGAAPDPPPAVPQGDGLRAKLEAARAVQKTDPKRARALLREILVTDPGYVPALADLSVKLLHDEGHDEARALSARCVAADPENEACNMVLQYALARGPEIDALAERTRACLTANPSDAKCLATMVGHDILEGKLDDAARAAETLARVAPGGKPALLAEARLASVAGRYSDARQKLEGACQQGMEQACFRAEALRAEGW